MFVGSVASSALPGSSSGHPDNPPADAMNAMDVVGAPVSSQGIVTLGATAATPQAVPVSVVHPAILRVGAAPSINPPPLGARARPLNAGPVSFVAPAVQEPEISSRSTRDVPPAADTSGQPAGGSRADAPRTADPGAPSNGTPPTGSPDGGAPQAGWPVVQPDDGSAPQNGGPKHHRVKTAAQTGDTAPQTSGPTGGSRTVRTTDSVPAGHGTAQGGSAHAGGHHRG
ncbi:MAG TPA: hypothetical protein VGJ13_01960 [Pseudonocardiaceae bacterium]|jgi:hypothetical protein